MWCLGSDRNAGITAEAGSSALEQPYSARTSAGGPGVSPLAVRRAVEALRCRQGRQIRRRSDIRCRLHQSASARTWWRVTSDAPEKGQAFGNSANNEALSDLAFGKPVIVVWQEKDRYGRTVGKVIVNGVEANLKMVDAGVAWHYKQYAKEQSPADRASYSRAEEEARAKGVGLWQLKLPVPPWEFRKKRAHHV